MKTLMSHVSLNPLKLQRETRTSKIDECSIGHKKRHSTSMLAWLTPSQTGNPFSGTELLEVGVGRGLGALKGLRDEGSITLRTAPGGVFMFDTRSARCHPCCCTGHARLLIKAVLLLMRLHLLLLFSDRFCGPQRGQF